VLGLPADFALGVRRARAAALLMLALPGGAYVYQGEELGLPEVEDLPEDALRDPAWEQSGHRNRGRDGCRVPLPWSGVRPPFGFSPDGASSPPWLPQPDGWRALTAESQAATPGSMLDLYRRALAIRRAHEALGDGSLEWVDAPAGVLSFARDPGFVCVVNLASEPVSSPAGVVLLASGPPTDDGRLPPESAVWIAR